MHPAWNVYSSTMFPVSMWRYDSIWTDVPCFVCQLACNGVEGGVPCFDVMDVAFQSILSAQPVGRRPGRTSAAWLPAVIPITIVPGVPSPPPPSSLPLGL